MNKVQDELTKRSTETVSPDGSSIEIVLLNDVYEVARLFGESIKSVELEALECGIVPHRYERNIGSIGVEGQIQLLQSTVAVVGVGGLGGVVCEILARSGVGTLLLIDDDEYDESNLNRQIHCDESNIGCSKVFSSKRRIAEINSAIESCHYDIRLTSDNAEDVIKSADVVVDCLDNIPSRFELQSCCFNLEISMVHGAVAGMMGQVMTIHPGDQGLELIYEEGYAERGVELSLGNLPSTVANVASMQCSEVMKVITGFAQPLEGKILFLDLASGSFHEVDIK